MLGPCGEVGMLVSFEADLPPSVPEWSLSQSLGPELLH